MTELRWFKGYPPRPGWYWWRAIEITGVKRGPHVVAVTSVWTNDDCRGLTVKGVPTPDDVYEEEEWAGPIAFPEG